MTTNICIECGLCCDGTLFADVELAGWKESDGLEVLGLEIDEDDQTLLRLPCAALKDKKCSIYLQRPKCCRTFECRLLQDVQRGAVSVVDARQQIRETLKKIARVKTLLMELGDRNVRLPLKERCDEILARQPSSDLESAMSEVENMIQKTFLAGGRT